MSRHSGRMCFINLARCTNMCRKLPLVDLHNDTLSRRKAHTLATKQVSCAQSACSPPSCPSCSPLPYHTAVPQESSHTCYQASPPRTECMQSAKLALLFTFTIPHCSPAGKLAHLLPSDSSDALNRNLSHSCTRQSESCCLISSRTLCGLHYCNDSGFPGRCHMPANIPILDLLTRQGIRPLLRLWCKDAGDKGLPWRRRDYRLGSSIGPDAIMQLPLKDLIENQSNWPDQVSSRVAR